MEIRADAVTDVLLDGRTAVRHNISVNRRADVADARIRIGTEHFTPISKLRLVTSISFAASSEIFPTGMVFALSP